MTGSHAPLEERIRRSVVITDTGCWEWAGSRNKKGYGRINVGKGVVRFAHRVSFELARGPVPGGLELDHLCRNTPCCNPDHLEPVTRLVNARRSPIVSIVAHTGRCRRGHDQAVHGYVRRDGGLNCRECRRERETAA